MIILKLPQFPKQSFCFKNKLFQFLLFTLFLFSSQISIAQLYTEHYIPPMFCEEYSGSNWPKKEVHLTTPSNTTIKVTDWAGNLYGAGEYEISNGSPYILDFDSSNDDQFLSVFADQVGIKQDGNGEGLKLTSTDQFYVNFKVRGNAQVGSLTSKVTFINNLCRVYIVNILSKIKLFEDDNIVIQPQNHPYRTTLLGISQQLFFIKC